MDLFVATVALVALAAGICLGVALGLYYGRENEC